MAVCEINNDLHFQTELAGAGIKLVVVDFTATWCGPCKKIAPLFDQLPSRYPRAVFLKVDVDKCQDTAATQGVSAMPTFIFYRNKAKIDRLQGSDIQGLEHKIRQHIGTTEDAGDDGEEYGQGMMDLTTFIEKSGSECLNESDDHPLGHCLTSGGYLQSDCDEQLILAVTFNQAVKIHSIKFKAPATLGPKNIRLFINQPRTLDFDQAESSVSIQDLVLVQMRLQRC